MILIVITLVNDYTDSLGYHDGEVRECIYTMEDESENENIIMLH